MELIQDLGFVADRLNMSTTVLYAVPFVAVVLLIIANRMTATRSSGIIFYKGGGWMAQATRFSFAATLTLSTFVLMLRINPDLQSGATRVFESLGKVFLGGI